MYYKVLIHSHFLFYYFKAGLQAAIVCPISKENIWRCNRSFYTIRFLASLYLFVFLSKNQSVKTTLKASSYKCKFSSTRKTSPAVIKMVNRSLIRDGPLENVWGGRGGRRRSTKRKFSRKGKLNENKFMLIHAN